MRIPLRYGCDKWYEILGGGGSMDEESFKEGMQYIQFLNGNHLVFQIPSYEIKDGGSCVRTGE